jgi:Zn ribbon nucleic-acid-binding protein
MLADQLCPECHGLPDLIAVREDRLVKGCADCGHRWNEPRENVASANEYGIDRKGYIRR